MAVRGDRVSERKRFFEAQAASGSYDATIRLVVPRYHDLHRMVWHLALSYARNAKWDRVNVLDLGSGTGADSINLLRVLPDPYVVAIDCSARMHDTFRVAFERVFPGRAFGDSVRPVLGDIVGSRSAPKRVLRALPLRRRADCFQLAVSCFAIHHLADEEKRLACAQVFESLAPGGLFVLGDLFTFQPTWLASEAHAFDIAWIRSQFSRAMSANRSLLRRKALAALRDEWLLHYECDNILGPVEQTDQKSAPRFSFDECLRATGFVGVSCVFRYWQSGLIVAQKPR